MIKYKIQNSLCTVIIVCVLRLLLSLKLACVLNLWPLQGIWSTSHSEIALYDQWALSHIRKRYVLRTGERTYQKKHLLCLECRSQSCEMIKV